MRINTDGPQRYIVFFISFIVISLILYIPYKRTSTPMFRQRKVGYFTSWSIYARNFMPSDVQVERLTHLNYGFANLVNNTIVVGDQWADIDKPFEGDSPTQQLKGNFGQFNNANSTVRRRNPNLRTLISVGGWTWSSGFSSMASSPHSRQQFIRSVCEFLQRYQFDGIDIDWEYPVEGGNGGTPHSPHDAHNFLQLLHELRDHLDHLPRPRFGRYEISIATSASRTIYRHLDLHRISKVVDFINIMAYDYAGSWSHATGHHQNLFPSHTSNQGITGDMAVSDYIHAGVPPHKIVLGIGFYGRGFAHVQHERTSASGLPGLGCPFSGVPKGTWEEGVFDYKALRNDQMLDPEYSVHWDDRAKAPFLYSHNKRILITYDDPVSISWKADYVIKRRLGGLMIWELSQDYNGELLSKVCEYLG